MTIANFGLLRRVVPGVAAGQQPVGFFRAPGAPGVGVHGCDVAEDRVDVAWMPGSFEIPVVARKMAESGGYAAVVCLGCVIRGETSHYDHVAGQAAAGVMQAGLATGVPVIFGVLTTETVEQALNRSGLKGGNKGAEAATTAIEMVNLLRRIEG